MRCKILSILASVFLCSRYHDYWRFVTQRLSFLVSLVVYLESDRLAGRSEVASCLGSEWYNIHTSVCLVNGGWSSGSVGCLLPWQ